MAAHVTRQVAGLARTSAGSAGVPILAAKITAPGVPSWAVPRPRITELITQGRRWCPLTLVTAPAGAGKTMALTPCLTSSNPRSRWSGRPPSPASEAFWKPRSAPRCLLRSYRWPRRQTGRA